MQSKRFTARWREAVKRCGVEPVVLSVLILLTNVALAAPDLPTADFQPPDTGDLCPALAENYELCVGDTGSGNCQGFVRDASRLGEIYRSEVHAHPGWVSELQSTIWWGCGSATLEDLRSLLARLDTAQARLVLAEEPYRSVAASRPPAAPAQPQPQRDCIELATQAEANACAAANLAQAKAEHERVFSACKQKVAEALRGELSEAEASWQKLLPLECAGSDYSRDTCLTRAYEQRTQSIDSLHPECASGD